MVLCTHKKIQRKGKGWNRDFCVSTCQSLSTKKATLLTKTLKKKKKKKKKKGHDTETISSTVANTASLPKISFHVLHIKVQAGEPGT